MTDHRTLHRLANARNEMHKYESHNRPLSKDYEYIGLVGEDEFAKTWGLPMNLCLKRNGDNGVDYVISGYSIDVKTLRDARYIKVEQGKCRAGIYVLYQYHDESDTAEFVGWITGHQLSMIPPRDTGRGIINHAMQRENLYDFNTLVRKLRG